MSHRFRMSYRDGGVKRSKFENSLLIFFFYFFHYFLLSYHLAIFVFLSGWYQGEVTNPQGAATPFEEIGQKS